MQSLRWHIALFLLPSLKIYQKIMFPGHHRSSRKESGQKAKFHQVYIQDWEVKYNQNLRLQATRNWDFAISSLFDVQWVT